MQRLLVLFLVFVSVDAGARLLVSKTEISKYPVALQDNVFQYEIINKGNSDAVNVILDDRASFPTDRFDIIGGSAHVKFHRIPAHSSAQHHFVVVPRQEQNIEPRDVIVLYKDEKSGRLHRVVAVPTGKTHDYYYPQKALLRVTGVKSEHFIGFAAIVLPTTILSIVFFRRSANRYTIKPNSS